MRSQPRLHFYCQTVNRLCPSDITGEVFSRTVPQRVPQSLGQNPTDWSHYYLYMSAKESSEIRDMIQNTRFMVQGQSGQVLRVLQCQIESATISHEFTRNLNVVHPGEPTFWQHYVSAEELEECIDLNSVVFDRALSDFTVKEEFKFLYDCAPEEVIQEVVKWKIASQVDKTLVMIHDLYRTLHDVAVSISVDPEVPDRRRVRAVLTVSGTPEEVFKDELLLKQRMYATLDLKAYELIAITYNWKS